MSKINQIQSAIKTMDGGSFQKLCDAYLHCRGYENPHMIGSVAGADKTTPGTPDTLFTLPTGKYVFAEYTTRQNRVFEKLRDDLTKCFDLSKTGVPTSDIDEVVLCFTSELESAQIHELISLGVQHGCRITLVGIGTLSIDLYDEYPGLARDFLEIDVDTGQIIRLDEFVAHHDKNALSAPLATGFHFRETEVAEILKGLESTDLVLLAGRPGVGKTRLGLEACRRFGETHPDYSIYAVHNRGADLYNDLRVYFSKPGCYLVLVDDANRLSALEGIFQYLNAIDTNHVVKAILTVRDYALSGIQERAKNYGPHTEVDVTSLDGKQVRELVQSECGINHHIFLDRIVSIAKGNPRIAVMAAKIAVEKGPLDSIADVSTLYDEYFLSIKRDVEDVSRPDVLKVAGIMAFFVNVDRSNEELMSLVSSTFNIPDNEFWAAVNRLHDLELVDLYEDEVAKVADQVLGTYLFYRAVFKSDAISLTGLIENLLPDFQRKFIDILNPVLNAFDRALVDRILTKSVDVVWRRAEETNDLELMKCLRELFWFVKQTETLRWAKSCVDARPPIVLTLEGLSFKREGLSDPDPVLNTLRLFRQAETVNRNLALQLILDLGAKCNNLVAEVADILGKDYGPHYYSYAAGYERELAVLSAVCQRIDLNKYSLFVRLFLQIAHRFVQVHFTVHEDGDGQDSITVTQFDVSPTHELTSLQRKLWNWLFAIHHAIPDSRPEVLDVLRSYIQSTYQCATADVVRSDAEILVPLVRKHLSPDSYSDCRTVLDLLRTFRGFHIGIGSSLRKFFTNETVELSKLLLYDHDEMRMLDLRESKERRIRRLEQYVTGFGRAEFTKLFERSVEVLSYSHRTHDAFEVRESIVDIFKSLAKSAPGLFAVVLRDYLHFGNQLEVGDLTLIRTLTQIVGANDALEILRAGEYAARDWWIVSCLLTLPQETVNQGYLDQLYQLFREAGPRGLIVPWSFLDIYVEVDPLVFVSLSEILLQRHSNETGFGGFLRSLIDVIAADRNGMRGFEGHIGLLKRIYFAVLRSDEHADHDGRAFAIILDRDNNFVTDYIHQQFAEGIQPAWKQHHRDLSHIWLRSGYVNRMLRVTKRIIRHEKTGFRQHYTFLRAFFIIHEGTESRDVISTRENAFLKRLIKSTDQDPAFLDYAFTLISELPPPKRYEFIACFLGTNHDSETFKRLQLAPSVIGESGGMVTALQKRVDYYEGMLPLFDHVDLLEHKLYVEQEITYLRQRIEREKRADYVRAG